MSVSSIRYAAVSNMHDMWRCADEINKINENNN